jgi:hypothetical protein
MQKQREEFQNEKSILIKQLQSMTMQCQKTEEQCEILRGEEGSAQELEFISKLEAKDKEICDLKNNILDEECKYKECISDLQAKLSSKNIDVSRENQMREKII